jgi:hypothetical protein
MLPSISSSRYELQSRPGPKQYCQSHVQLTMRCHLCNACTACTMPLLYPWRLAADRSLGNKTTAFGRKSEHRPSRFAGVLVSRCCDCRTFQKPSLFDTIALRCASKHVGLCCYWREGLGLHPQSRLSEEMAGHREILGIDSPPLRGNTTWSCWWWADHL